MWEPTLDTHTPLLSQLLPRGRRAFLGMLSSFFPGTCFLSSPCPGRRDALVLGPRFKLSSSHWPGPASSGRSTSLGKEPKPWAFSQPPRPASSPVPALCPWCWLHAWTSLTREVAIPTHTLVFSLLLHLHTHGLYISYPPKRDGRFPFDCQWRSDSQGHILCVRDLPGEMRVDEGQGQVWAPALQWFPGVQQVRHQRATLAILQSLSCVQLFVTPRLHHARLPRSSLFPGVCSDSCPLSHWCYLTISPSAALFSFCLQSFPASGSFPLSWLLTWD